MLSRLTSWFTRKHSLTKKRPTPPLSEIKKRIRIVVIDDDENSFPVDALKQDGYAIDLWRQIDAGNLHKLEEGLYDVIILDIGGVAKQLSFDDGLGVLEHLKRSNPAQVGTPLGTVPTK